jgi:hypothetical protein
VTTADDLIREELWKTKQLERLGLDRPRATTLVDLNVDWHDVDELVAAGCDPTLASSIAARTGTVLLSQRAGMTPGCASEQSQSAGRPA